MVTQEQLNKAMSYLQYHNLLDDLMAHGKTTGPNQNEDYLNYAKLNLQRMKRLDKTATLNSELESALKNTQSAYVWLVLTEGWCGDASQCIPVLAAMAHQNNCITLKFLLRDENTELMDQYLTGSSRSIPKLICLEQETLREIFTWGPRPAEVQELMLELKRLETPLAEKSLAIQKWYNADKTQSLQKEFLDLIQKFMK